MTSLIMRQRILTSLLVLFVLYCTPLVAAEDSIAWGNPREGVKIGIQRSISIPGNGVVIVYVQQVTNYLRNLVLPSESYQRFDFSLVATNLPTIKKTDEGKKYGEKLQTSMPRRRIRVYHLKYYLGNEPQQIGFFYFDKCFILKEAGEYELEIRPRLLKEEGKKLVPVIFEPIKLRVPLSANSN